MLLNSALDGLEIAAEEAVCNEPGKRIMLIDNQQVYYDRIVAVMLKSAKCGLTQLEKVDFTPERSARIEKKCICVALPPQPCHALTGNAILLSFFLFHVREHDSNHRPQ